MTDLRSHFGFSQTPFTPEIPVAKRFSHPVFDEPLADLERTVSERMSAAVIAAAGTYYRRKVNPSCKCLKTRNQPLGGGPLRRRQPAL